MTTQQETYVSIDFAKGLEITPIVVFEGVELESKTFSNKTHQIEELIDFVHSNENGGYDVFV